MRDERVEVGFEAWQGDVLPGIRMTVRVVGAEPDGLVCEIELSILGEGLTMSFMVACSGVGRTREMICRAWSVL